MPTARHTIESIIGSGTAELRDAVTGEVIYAAGGVRAQQASIDGHWSCTLPLPPTTNNLFINRRNGRAVSAEYDAWKARAAAILDRKAKWGGGYPITVTITILGGSDWRMNADIANREKATVDALVAAGIIHADSCKHVQRVTITFEHGPKDLPSVVRVGIAVHEK